MNRRIVATLAALLAPLTLAPAAQAQKGKASSPLAGLDAYVAQQMRIWKVPGMALAVVKDDSLILARGYGVRALGSPAPVDANTIFAIGSSSKAFTAALVAMAVDEGKMKWDGKVAEYLPGYQLYDGYASRDLTMRDVLSHRSGLARGDLLWYGTDYSRDEILRRTRYLKPSWGFRAQFGYQNLMFLAAGEAVARAERSTWDDLVRARIFAPLGMTQSMTSVRDLAGRDNVAMPHREDDSVVKVIAWKNIDNIGPAGSINSNVTDMAKWVRFQLAKGKAGDRQLITSGNLTEMWLPNTHIRQASEMEKSLTPNGHLAAYGMGWFLQDFNGHLAVHHGGNIDGFSAMVAMLPDEKLGVVVLTNLNGTFLRDILWAYILDAYTNGKPRDFSPQYQQVMAGARKQAQEAEALAEKARVTGTSPSLPLAQYAGVYSDSMYGDFTVTEAGGTLRARFGLLSGTLEHWNYDTFRVVMADASMGKPMVRFTVNEQGKAAKLSFQAVPEADFTLSPPKADATGGPSMSEAELKKYVGSYKPAELPLTIEVQIVGGQLKATVPGQPTYTLVPESATRFRLAADGMPAGFYFDFDLRGDIVAGATLVQPAPRPSLKLVRQ